MTLKEIEAMDRETLTPAIVGSVLNADPHEIRLQARHRPELLGFPVICVGTRVKIPKEGFLLYCRGLLGNRQPPAANTTVP